MRVFIVTILLAGFALTCTQLPPKPEITKEQFVVINELTYKYKAGIDVLFDMDVLYGESTKGNLKLRFNDFIYYDFSADSLNEYAKDIASSFFKVMSENEKKIHEKISVIFVKKDTINQEIISDTVGVLISTLE